MLGRAFINSSLTSKILRSCSERKYHIFQRPNVITYHETVLQAGRAPGKYTIMPVGFPRNPIFPPQKNFTIAGMKKHYGVLPIVVIMGVVTVGVAAMSIFAARTKDIVWSNSKPKPWETIDLRNPKNRKLIKTRRDYEPLPELASLLEEMERAEKGGGAAAEEDCGPGAPCARPPPPDECK